MQKSGIVYVRIISLASLLFAISEGMAQKPADTTYIISSTDRYTSSPLNLSNNPFYDIVDPNKPGIRPTVFYSGDDRLFVGLNYNWISKSWRNDTAGQKHKLYTHYSINQKAFSVGYQGFIYKLIGQWNLFLNAGYDWVKWVNFYGLGNETIELTENRDFYRFRRREALLSASLQRRIGNDINFVITPYYQRFHLINDEERFLSKNFFDQNSLARYEAKNFGGLRADWQWQSLNNPLLPTKGVILSAGVNHVRNLNAPKSYTNYMAYTRLFLPFFHHFVFSTEGGAATLTGDPEFYQLNSIGGNSLRGYRRERFWGETSFHNNNELQYIFDIKTKVINGKLGFLAFADQGRVWKRGEQSDTWHYGYGGGIMLVPYHKLYFSVQYGISNERKLLHVEFRRSF
jgi:outer membrane protein assembly factor BamA